MGLARHARGLDTIQVPEPATAPIGITAFDDRVAICVSDDIHAAEWTLCFP